LFALPFSSQSQCIGLKANAGQDIIICDPNQTTNLQGSIQGNYLQYSWSPVFGLSDPNILDPIITAKNPGTYTFQLSVEGHSSTNLIVNGDFESGNSGFTSDYFHFSLPGWIPTAAYAVDANPAPYYVPEFEACGDHTTGSGNMMINNGTTVPGLDVWCQTVVVKPNTDYYFESFFTSLYPTAPSTIRISFNGKPISTVQLTSATCDWMQYATSWNSGAATSVTICMQDMNLIGWGNDFAIDDIGLFEKCYDTDDVKVEIVNLTAKLDIPFKPKCSSDSFSISAAGSSSGPNIKYQWSTDVGKIISQNGLNAIGKGSGIYTVKVIYTNGNFNCEQEASVEYIAPDVLAGTVLDTGKINCGNDSLRLQAKMISGSGNYSYKWSPDTSILKGQNTNSVWLNKSGKYSVTITDQTSGCILVLDYDVKVDTLKPIAGIKGDTLLDCRKSKALLSSSLTDSVKYNIKWIAPDLSVIANQSTILDSLSGMYKLIIEDNSNHCKDSASWNVGSDTIHPNLNLGNDLNIDCKNNAVIVTNTLANPNDSLLYYWTIDTTHLLVENNLLNKTLTKASTIQLRLANLKNGCETTDSLLVTDSRNIPQLEAGNNELLSCKQKSIQLHATVNPNDTLNISWTSASGNIVAGKNSLQPVVDKKGWYYIHITNSSNGCDNLDSLFVDENTVSPNAVLGPDLIFSCIDTIKTIDGSGSSSGNSIIYNWTTTNGTIKSGNGSSIIAVSNPGLYKLIVQDTLNGCSDTAVIHINPDQNKPIVAIVSPDTLSCLHTDITLTATANSQSGSTLNFKWTNNAGASIQSPNTLQTKITVPGIYIFTATDQSNGCSSTVQTLIAIDTTKPLIAAGPDQIWNCASTQLNLSGTLILNPDSYTYNWSTLNGSITGNPNKKDISISAPGTYYFLVIDEINGCSSVDSLSVIPDLTKPVVNIPIPDTLNCIHSVITLSAQGSSANNRIIYLWQTANGNIVGAANQTDILVDKPGNYQLTVSDTINKCTAQQSIPVIEDKQPPIADAGNPAILTCQLPDLILTGNISNSINSKVVWKTTQGNIISKTDSLQIKINKPGLYFLQVINTSNGCTGIDSVLVTKINKLSVNATGATELTCKIKDAILSGSILNNTGNEQINWTTSQGHFTGSTNTPQVTVDRPGWYYFQVTNNTTGCNGIDSVLITENTNIPVSVNLDIAQPKCPGDSWSAQITKINGGENPIQVFLNNQLINGLILQGNQPGNYLIKLSDKNGCELTTNFDILSPQGVTIQLIPLVRLSEGQDYNIVPMYSIPDDSIASVQWSPFEFLSCTDCPYPVIKGIENNTDYSVTYTNHNGCSATARIRIEIVKRNIWVPNAFSANGDNINDSFYPTVTEDSYNTIRSMSIYDRWGELIFRRENFQANDPAQGWNGEFNNDKVNPGVYVYVIEVEWKNGDKQIVKGDVTLIR
jgi:gliding motility-associated-like protein